MIHITLPKINTFDITNKCISGHSAQLALDFVAHRDEFFTHYTKYEIELRAGRVINMARSDAIGPMTKDLMLELYQKQLVSKSGHCRNDYDRILALSPRKKCPMCSESTVTALDHHLPKSTYFLHSINVMNLVPICSRCNEAKKHTMPNEEDKQFIHPYFDDFSSRPWFNLVFRSHDPIDIDFECAPPDDLDQLQKSKLLSHFRRLKLNELYAANAIGKLEDISYNFSKYVEMQDWDAVKSDLEVLLDNAKKRKDSWEFALYSKLINEEWYIQGGFQNI